MTVDVITLVAEQRRDERDFYNTLVEGLDEKTASHVRIIQTLVSHIEWLEGEAPSMISVFICIALMTGTAFWVNYEYANWIPFIEHVHQATSRELGFITFGVMSLFAVCVVVMMLCPLAYRRWISRGTAQLRRYVTVPAHHKAARLILETKMHNVSLHRSHLALIEHALTDS